jgi:branched-subunit amino acid ABC-type transport system permease component/ABC-type branched-subunit amino acid transport system ATPase component
VQRFFNLVVSGAVSGAIYSIMAAGLVLTYQTSGIFNFAHGAVAFAVAYFYYQLNTGQDIHWIPALILSVLVFAPLLGLLLDRILLRRLAAAPVYARIVGTIGLFIALPALIQWLAESFGDVVFDLRLPVAAETQAGGNAPGVGPNPAKVFRVFDIVLDSNKIAVLVAAALSALVLWYVLRRTRAGLSMRAVVDRRDLASLRGINDARTSALAWILSMVLAGLGGILLTPIFQLSDITFSLVVFGSLAAVALAGLRSIPIAFVGGLALGVLQNLLQGYSRDLFPKFIYQLSGLKGAIPFVLTLVLLFVYASRASGREAGTVADETPSPDHRDGLPAWRRRLPWAIFTVVLLAYSLQWIDVGWLQADLFEAASIAKGIAVGLIFLSFVVVTGIGGMVSLAQATFVTAGGFMAGWALQNDWGFDIPGIASHGQLNFLWAALMGAVVAAIVGALLALPVRRLGALALAIGTFALAFAAQLVVFQSEDIGNGSGGWSFRPPSLDVPILNDVADLVMKGPQDKLDFSQPQAQILMLLVVFGAVTLLVHGLMRSASGRAMLATRSSEVAARTSGISTSKQKVVIFALSAAIAGFGGAFYGVTTFAVSSSSVPPLLGLVWLAIAVTFGIRRPGGALLAGLSFACSSLVFTWIGDDFLGGDFSELTSSAYFLPILFGLGAINLAKNPDGLLSLIGHERLEKKRAKEREALIASAEAAAHGGEVPEHERVHAEVAAAPTTSTETAGTTPGDAEAAPAALALRGLVAGYGAVEVLHGVDLDVRSGTVLALLGANGAGKSTLCNVTAGLYAPTAGKVLLRGEDVTAHAAFLRQRDGILLVPEARGIFPGLSVEENLEVLLRTATQRDAAYARFPILGERRSQLAGSLSGGEQQMLSLAPALADPPAVFMADEPTLGLAPLAAEVVLDAVRELRDMGTAVLLVEEKAREVMQLADTVAFMELGRIVWMGPRSEADAERLAAAYLGSAPPAS